MRSREEEQKNKVIKRWRFLVKRYSIRRWKLIKRCTTFWAEKRAGNIGELMATGVCILAMTAIMLFYLDSAQLISQKTEVSQIARKYILRMETVGRLKPEDGTALTQELQEMGVTEVDLNGTTTEQVNYGMPITLQIQGKLRGEYAFQEQRVSTSKN